LSGFLEQAREAFQRRVWGDAYDRLVAADRETPLPGEDLERLAVAGTVPLFMRRPQSKVRAFR
jgi:hypothetical protein